jgi:site-specific recombinase XerD
MASVLISNGVDVVTTSKMLGHASVTTTESFYAHVIEDAKDAATETVAAVLLKRKA